MSSSVSRCLLSINTVFHGCHYCHVTPTSFHYLSHACLPRHHVYHASSRRCSVFFNFFTLVTRFNFFDAERCHVLMPPRHACESADAFHAAPPPYAAITTLRCDDARKKYEANDDDAERDGDCLMTMKMMKTFEELRNITMPVKDATRWCWRDADADDVDDERWER